MRRWLMGLCAVLLALAWTTQPLLAAGEPSAPRLAGLTCVNGVCRARLNLGLDGGWLQVAEQAVRALPGGELALREDVLLQLPSGPLRLADADLRLTLDETGRVATLRGSAMLPVPLFGLLGDAHLITPARVEVGVELGRELQHLAAPLEPGRRYFFIDMQAGMGLAVGGVDLTVPVGQRATLVVDFMQPLVFIDGAITLRSDRQLALIRAWMDGAGEVGLPTELPLRQIASFHIQGQWGRDIAPHLALASSLRFDGGLVGRWLRIDATPLLAQGRAILDPRGLFFAGELHSSIAADRLYATGAQAELFVPFAAPETASLTLRAEAEVPLLDVAGASAATLAGEPGWHMAWVDAAWVGVTEGVAQIGAATATGTAWVGDTTAAGGKWLAAGTAASWAYTRGRWCGLTGWCAADTITADTIAAAITQIARAE